MKSPNEFNIDFFGIGAGKCGSTWLAQCLNEHPQITIAKGKEPNFFVEKLSAFGGEKNKNFMADWEWYRTLFNDAKSENKLGDFSINLIHNVDNAPKLILQYFPQAKFIVTLRDPVYRTYSHYWHEKRYDLVQGVPNNFEEALDNKELLFRSMYYEQLKKWFQIFPRDRFYIVLDYDLKKDTSSVLRSLYSFLEVDSSFMPSSLYKRINESSKRNWFFIASQNAAKKAKNLNLYFLVDVLKFIGIKRLVQYFGVKKASYPSIKPETEKKLREYFQPDIERLEILIERDLSSWKT